MHSFTPKPSIRGRLTLVAIGALLVVATTLGVAVGPASAAVPERPEIVGAFGYSDGVHVLVVPPTDDGGEPIRGYQLFRTPVGSMATTAIDKPDSVALLDTTAVPGIAYTYAVGATNSDGTSDRSSSVPATRPIATANDYTKFSGSIGAFVNRQYLDFFGRPATATELLAGQVTLNAGGDHVAPFLASVATNPARASRLAIVRLYFAYFKRGPDHGGLAYWTAQIAAKKKNLDNVSNSFARSTEFKRAYGSLSNADFVTLVYQNVLGRAPEATGFAFWKRQLDQKVVIRGRVMTQFSESDEFKTSSKGVVQASEAWDAMLGTNIPIDRLSLFSDFINAGGSIGDIARLILNLAAYTL